MNVIAVIMAVFASCSCVQFFGAQSSFAQYGLQLGVDEKLAWIRLHVVSIQQH